MCYMKKVTVNGTVVLHQHYLYHGYLQIAALDLTRSNAPALWLLHWDPTQPVATRPLSLRKNGTWYTYGHDLTKNVTELYKADGTIATAYDYTPYGTVTANGIDQPIQWSSEHYDPELALVYYNYRHYNPADGRWINRDPIAEKGGRNLYAFVGNAPTLYCDSLGLWAREDEWTFSSSGYKGHICAQENDSWETLYKEIAGEIVHIPKGMPEKGKIYEVAPILQALEKQIRNNIVAATKSLNANFGKVQYFDLNWQGDELDRFFHEGRGPLECHHAVLVVVAKGVMDTVGKSVFNDLFTLRSFKKPDGQYLMQVKASDIKSMQLGDWGYIKNDPRYDSRLGSLQGENIIKLGDDQFWGHGIPVPSTEEEVKEILTRGSYMQGIKEPIIVFDQTTTYFPHVAKIGQAVFDYKKSKSIV